MDSPIALLAELRAGERPEALAHAPDPTERQAHSALRAKVTRALATTISPFDHAATEWLLREEIADAEAAGQGATESLYTLVAALARFARPEDVPLLWRARQATPEARAGVDVEQLLRAGPEAVRAYLRRSARGTDQAARDAAEALAWIEEGLAAGAGDGLPAYFTWSDERFGLHVSGPT